MKASVAVTHLVQRIPDLCGGLPGCFNNIKSNNWLAKSITKYLVVYLMQWQTHLPEKILLTTWAHVNRTSGKITNIRKSAFPLLFILFQINILFYFPQEFALRRFGWILSNSLCWSKATEKGLPNYASCLAKMVIITFPTWHNNALGRQEYHGKKMRWMESNTLR